MTKPLGEVLFEIRRVGGFVKCSAIDPVSNVEVSIIGPPGAPEQHLKMTALRKLEYVLSKNAG